MDDVKRQYRAISGAIKATDKEIDALFAGAVKRVVEVVTSLGLDLGAVTDGPQFLALHPEIRDAIERITADLSGALLQSLQAGVLRGWELAEEHADATIGAYLGRELSEDGEELKRALLARRKGASMDFLRSRMDERLSDSVWDTSQRARKHISDSLAEALTKGVSADELSLTIQRDLKEPSRLVSWERDKDTGALQLSAETKAYHPGAGVYRSSYKNAKRLARTEINMAYRTADHNRWQDKDFVVGIRVQLSHNHNCNGIPFTDICDDLQGVYPKSFSFRGWHPQCRCIATPILEDRDHYLARRLHGEGEAPQQVEAVPKNYTKWLEANEDRLEQARRKGTLPYFVTDNPLK